MLKRKNETKRKLERYEHLGLLDFLFVEEDEAPSLVIDPNLSISTIPFLYNATTPTIRTQKTTEKLLRGVM